MLIQKKYKKWNKYKEWNKMLIDRGLALIRLSGAESWWTNTFIGFKSVNSNFCVLISSRNPEYHWLFTVLGQ